MLSINLVHAFARRVIVLVLMVCVSVCLSVCLSVTALAGATGTRQAELRYLQQTLDVGNKRYVEVIYMNFGLTVKTIIRAFVKRRCQLVTGAITRSIVYVDRGL